MTWLRDIVGTLPRVPLVLAAGLGLSAGTAGAYVGPDEVSPPYGWGRSELSQPIRREPATRDEAGIAAPVTPTVTAIPGSGTRD